VVNVESDDKNYRTMNKCDATKLNSSNTVWVHKNIILLEIVP